MKKILSTILVVIIAFSFLSISVFAENTNSIISENVEYFDDGSYIVTTLTVSDESYLSRATVSKTGSKKVVLYNSSDEAMVTLKLTATFTYTGSSATCTAATPSYTIHEDSWKVTTATASKSGNKATGNFTAKHYALLIPIQTRDVAITITCSNTGTLS